MQFFIAGFALIAALLAGTVTAGANPIRHVIIIMQENRSFDSYFGTFPGANGLDLSACIPLLRHDASKRCVKPFHDPLDSNAGGPHSNDDAQADLDDGVTRARNDGFVERQSRARMTPHCLREPNDPHCAAIGVGVRLHDVMGYHTAEEIPNYWAYAQNFVLQDAMFAGVRSWSLPAHLDLVSEWVATCSNQGVAASCITTNDIPYGNRQQQYPWVSLFQLFDVHGVSWKYYLATGGQPDCEDDEMDCPPSSQDHDVPSIWNPGPAFTYVKALGTAYRRDHFVAYEEFAKDVARGRLPQVSWIVPDEDYSEHPPAAISTGMEYVTSVVNLIMQSPAWKSSAIFITWDDWGGFYDHVAPPIADTNQTATPVQGFGLRVPGLMISAYAKAGFVDHDVYSDDSYARFIEDLFAGGARLDPAQLGNPDARPTIRDAMTEVKTIAGDRLRLGDLMNEFDFRQPPRAPIVLSASIPTRISVTCDADRDYVCRSASVTVSWTAVTGAAKLGLVYYVERDRTMLAQCTGPDTSCKDTPGPGEHLYRAYTADHMGNVSPRSPAARAFER